MTLVNRRTIKCDEPGCPATFTLLRAYFASKGHRSGMIRGPCPRHPALDDRLGEGPLP